MFYVAILFQEHSCFALGSGCYNYLAQKTGKKLCLKPIVKFDIKTASFIPA